MLPWPAPHVPEIPGRGEGLRLFDPALGQAQPVGGPDAGSLAVCVAVPVGGMHLGHVVTAVTFDLVVRAWLDAGRIVTTLQHVATPLQHVATPLQRLADSEGAADLGVVEDRLATYAQHMTALGVIPPDHLVGPTDPVEDVVVAVDRMLATGQAFRILPMTGADGQPGHRDGGSAGERGPHVDSAGVAGALGLGREDGQARRGDIYAPVGDDPLVGTMSGLTRDRLLALAADDDDDDDDDGAEAIVAGRSHRLDVLLWRETPAGRPFGAGGSPDRGPVHPGRPDPGPDPGRLGRPGRPGRDILCATAVLAHLDGSCDVLGGGVEAVVHHENMASHLRALTGATRPVRCLVQTGAVTVDGVPVGRGHGTPAAVSDLLEQGAPPMALRLAVLAHHYRADWAYAPADLDAARERLRRWTAAVSGNGGPPVENLVTEVRAALSKDLDAPRALRAVDAWADRALSYGQPGGLMDAEVVEGAPGVAARVLDALLGVRL